MKTSVALCTYNGEKYLPEQLQSLAGQTLLPDEVVICDDGSTDNTLNVIETFSLSAPFPVRIHRNGTNLGSTKNFEKALGLCNGDVLFLCDQDDIWLPKKIEKMISCFHRHPPLAVLFTDGYVVNDRKEIVSTLWGQIKFSPDQKASWKKGESFKQIMRYGNRATGATMALRRSFLEKALPFERMNFWLHDGLITVKAALWNNIDFIDEKLISYRQHQHQQVGVNQRGDTPLQSLGNKIQRRKWINRNELLPLMYEDACSLKKIVERWNNRADYREIITKKIKHLGTRLSACERNRLVRPFIILPEWLKGHYKEYAYSVHDPTWVLVVKDLFGK